MIFDGVGEVRWRLVLDGKWEMRNAGSKLAVHSFVVLLNV